MTKSERIIYDYIVKYKKINGYSPSTYEIAKGCNYSRTYIRNVLLSLHDSGIIRYTPEKRRSITILKFL